MIILILLTSLLFGVSVFLFKQLLKLRGEEQIYAEVAHELHQRAHKLLVQKDHIESSLSLMDLNAENEQWKNELAQYMDDYEHEGRQRTRARLPKR